MLTPVLLLLMDSLPLPKREIKSSIAVASGDTIALGGLIRDNRDYDKTGLPILSRLPLIGPLFGTTTKNKDRTELVILITPRVIESRKDALQITSEFKRRLTGIYQDVKNSDVQLEITIPKEVTHVIEPVQP